MLNLSDLNPEQLTYLKQKWSSEAHELNREILRNASRLNARIERQTLNQQEIDTLLDDEANARQLLDHLTATNAPAPMIDAQQALLDRLTEELATANSASNGLTATEAILQQAGIDELVLQKQYREDKVSEIEILIGDPEIIKV